MLIKVADDKRKRIALLQELQQSPRLKREQVQWLREELHRLQRGLQGERDAAHYLDRYLKDDPDRALLHDLRFEIEDDVVQIDHLMMTRGLHVYLLETKCFGGNVRINEHGEWTVTYPGGRAYGVPSPLEQSRRHEGPLLKLLDRLGIVGRAGTRPKVHHGVLLHPKAVITRPDETRFDTGDVIKADQFSTWHQRKVDENSAVGVLLGAALNMRSAETLRDFAEKLRRQHRAGDPLALPEFMKLGAMDELELVRAKCLSKISFAEGRFCWSNDRRFGGVQYGSFH